MTEAVFVGRSGEIARGQRAVDDASGARGGLLLFSGEAGIGKTRVADEIARIAAQRDARIAWGRCWEAGGAPPYWPWIQILRALGVEDDLFSGDDREVRFRQFDRAATRLKHVASDKLLVVVLDDLHTADVPSLLFLHFLARDLRSTRLLVLGTYRDAEARLAPEVFALLAKIAREGDAVPLPRLTRADVQEWIRARLPDADDAAAERVHRTTEGNALFVQELLRVRGTPAEGDLPDGLRAILDEHLERVSSDVRDVLTVASVLGRDLDGALVATLASLPITEVEARLRAAHEGGLLASIRGGQRLSFAHILVRERLYASLPPQRRAELHVALAEHLLSTGGDPATVAFHFVAGREAASADRAARALLAAARSAQSQIAFEDAARFAQVGLELLAGNSEGENDILACDLELVAGEALMTAGDSKPGQEACLRAADRAKRLSSPERQAKAALTYALDIVTGTRDGAMVSLLGDALAALPPDDSCIRAKVSARHAAARVPPRSRDEAYAVVSDARDAIAMADRVGDDDTILYTYKFGSSAMGYLIASDERSEHITRIMPLVEKLGRNVELLNLGGWWIAHLRERGALDRADDVLERMKRAVTELPQPHYRWRIPMLEAQKALFAGDFAEADRLGRAAIAMEGSPMAKIHYAMQRLSLALARDDIREIRREREEGVFEPFSFIPTHANPFLGWLDAVAGREDDARRRIEEAMQLLDHYPMLLMSGEATLVLGDRELAERMYPALREHAKAQVGFWSSHGSLFAGPTARVVGRLAALLGRTDEARAAFEESIRICERMHARPYLELSKKDLAALGSLPPQPVAARARHSVIAMDREGDVWRIAVEGRTIRVKDTKGLAYLADLVARPGEDLHVTQLAELSDPTTGDAGPVLDAKAKAAYKERVDHLRAEIEEANHFGDYMRVERAEDEIEAIARQIAAAVGLGGRDRKAASHIERARINVQRRLKDAIQRIAEHDAALGRYLSAAVKTGTYCSFTPF